MIGYILLSRFQVIFELKKTITQNKVIKKINLLQLIQLTYEANIEQ